MKLKVIKRKLPKTLAYPINSTFLEKVISESHFDITQIEAVEYFHHQPQTHFFEAHYKGIKNKAFAQPGTIDIVINATPLTVFKYVKSQLIPLLENDFKQWLNLLRENEDRLSKESAGFHIWYRDNQMVAVGGSKSFVTLKYD